MHVDDPAFDEHLVSRAFMASPYDALRLLREEDPVHWSDALGGWVVTRYDDVVRTYLDVDAYSNEGRLAGTMAHLPPEEQQLLPAFSAFYRAKGLIHSDPPDHTRLRRLLVTWGFTTAQVEALRPQVQALVDGLLDAVEPQGNMDVIEDLAFALPITVLCQLLGVPAADAGFIRDVAARLLGFQGRNRPELEALLAAQEAILELREYVTLTRRRIADGSVQADGVLGRMLAAQASPEDALGEDEVVNTLGTLLIAGHETTTSLVGNGLLTVLRHPEQWQLLRERPELVPAAIEEMLRYESPLTRQPRLLRQDTELGGRRLRAGETVFQMINAANRDPEHFDDPDRFDVTRPRSRHLAFGQGIHFCLGAPLARLEGQIVFDALIARLPEIRLVDEEADWVLDKPTVRLLHTLPVAF